MPVSIHGKEYKTVAERVVEFHALNKKQGNGTSITTKVLKDDGDVVIVKAKVVVYGEGSKAEGERFTGEGTFTGHAEEVRGSTMINKTSALENAETSAIGRALASYGLVGTEFASADEVANAISQQSASASKPVSRQAAAGGGRPEKSASNDEALIGFGKHKGKKYSEIPRQYLEWLTSRKDTDEVTLSFANEEILRRMDDDNDVNPNTHDDDDLSFLDDPKPKKEEPKKEVSTGNNVEPHPLSKPMSPLSTHNEMLRLSEVLTGLSERIGWKEFTKIKQDELGKKGFKECSIEELKQLQSVLEQHAPAVKPVDEKKQTELLGKVMETFDGEIMQ